MFSQTVEYALRATVYLAMHPDRPAVNADVARVTKVPAAYLAKVWRSLARAGIVHAQRGVGGGVRLTRSADEISILDIVNAVEPIQRIKTCPLGLKSHGIRLCALHARMDKAIAGIESAFRNSTLGELLAEPNDSVALCESQTVRIGLSTVHR